MKTETRLLKAHRKLNGISTHLWEVKGSYKRGKSHKSHTVIFQYPLFPFKKGELYYIEQICFG
jgi:hypothetical protein